MDVVLSNAECRAAALVGIERRLTALANQTHEVYGKAHDGLYWEVDVEAAAGELAVAKAMGVFWSAADSAAEDRAGGDLGTMGGRVTQVRHTKRLNGSLICHPRDHDDHVFILVVGAMPRFKVVGWLHGADAKNEQWWRTDRPRPAFFVPQHALAPFS